MSRIADINLKEEGHQRIEWVAQHMPVLNAIGDRFEKDFRIHPHRAMLCVVGIAFHFLDAICTVAVVRLAVARNAGAYRQKYANVLRVLIQPIRGIRARPDQTHIADQYIDQLGQFVNTKLAQKFSYLRFTK